MTTDIDGQTRDIPPDIGADEVLTSPTPGSVQFSAPTYSIGEAGGTVTLNFTRTGGSAGAISVNYATANGTATGGASCGAGVDYVTTGGTLNCADGDTAPKTFNVTICNEATFEPDEIFTATLSGAVGKVTVSDVRVFDGDTGGANAVFKVTYTGSNPLTVSVQYATAGGTATPNVDYVSTSGNLSFASSNTQWVTVAIIGKTLEEANETFFLNLSNPVNATIADG